MSEPMIDPNAPIPMAVVTPDYAIAEEYSRGALENIVTKLMARGWKPTGGVHVRKAPQWSFIYTQALIKEV
jgi:hypothetical protein